VVLAAAEVDMVQEPVPALSPSESRRYSAYALAAWRYLPDCVVIAVVLTVVVFTTRLSVLRVEGN
jgi:hypothetical protein